MRVSRGSLTLRQRGRTIVWLTMAAAVTAFISVGCGNGDSAPEPLETPQETLEGAAIQMASLTSLSFVLSHEEGYSPLFPGVEAQRVEGVVALPDQAGMEVEARVSALGSFISIKIVVDGADATMTDPLTGALRSLPASSLPFNFLDLGATLGAIALAMQDPAFTEDRTIDGVSSRGIAGTVTGLDLRTLIPAATAEAEVRLEVWVGEDSLIRRVSIDGVVVSNDPAGVVRILTFGAFDQSVTIEPLT